MDFLQIWYGDFVLAWYGFLSNRKRIKLWNLVLRCVIWSLWFERNKINFEGCVPDLQKFLYTLNIRVRVWAKEIIGYKYCSSHEFVHNIDAILK